MKNLPISLLHAYRTNRGELIAKLTAQATQANAHIKSALEQAFEDFSRGWEMESMRLREAYSTLGGVEKKHLVDTLFPVLFATVNLLRAAPRNADAWRAHGFDGLSDDSLRRAYVKKAVIHQLGQRFGPKFDDTWSPYATRFEVTVDSTMTRVRLKFRLNDAQHKHSAVFATPPHRDNLVDQLATIEELLKKVAAFGEELSAKTTSWPTQRDAEQLERASYLEWAEDYFSTISMVQLEKLVKFPDLVGAAMLQAYRSRVIWATAAG